MKTAIHRLVQWIDTHAHIYYPELQQDKNWARTIKEHKVIGICMPAISQKYDDALFSTHQKNLDLCFPMAGLHPCYVDESYEQELALVQKNIQERKKDIVAIGEIGLDFYHDTTYKQQQIEVFRQQLAWSITHRLPVAIHARNATQEVVDIICRDFPEVKGVLHCFAGSLTLAKQSVEQGLFLGVGGTITYKNNHELRSVIKAIGLEHIVLETDTPYLTPQPFRGKTNTPAMIPTIGSYLAELLNISTENIARKTTQNACDLFSLNHLLEQD